MENAVEPVTSCRTSAPGIHTSLWDVCAIEMVQILLSGLSFSTWALPNANPSAGAGFPHFPRDGGSRLGWESPEPWMCRDRHKPAPTAREEQSYQRNNEAALSTNKYKIKNLKVYT